MIFLSRLNSLNLNLTFSPIFMIDQNIPEENHIASTQNIYGFILRRIFKNVKSIPSIIFNPVIFHLKILLK